MKGNQKGNPDNFRGRRFTPEEDARLEELRLIYPGSKGGRPRTGSCGDGLLTIARTMGRSKASVQFRLCMLAAKAEGEKYESYAMKRRTMARVSASTTF